MPGEKTKFHIYATKCDVTIPKPIARALGWEHKDEINLEIKTIDGSVGLFLYKEKKEK